MIHSQDAELKERVRNTEREKETEKGRKEEKR